MSTVVSGCVHCHKIVCCGDGGRWHSMERPALPRAEAEECPALPPGRPHETPAEVLPWSLGMHERKRS